MADPTPERQDLRERTAEDLTSPEIVGPAYAAVYEVIRRWPGSAERNAVVWRAVEAHRAALAGDPGDLPARMAETLRDAAYVCPGDDCPLSEEECQGEHPITLVATHRPPDGGAEVVFIEGTTAAIAEVFAGVRDEQMASLAARADKAEERLAAARTRMHDLAEDIAAADERKAEVAALQRKLAQAETDRDTNFSVLQRVSKGGWETATELVNERIARKQAERELAEARAERDALRARLTGVAIHAHRLKTWIADDKASIMIAGSILADLFAALDAPQRPEDARTGVSAEGDGS